MKLLITGANGFLGSRLAAWYGKQDTYDSIPVTRSELDFTHRDAVNAAFHKFRPDIVIHCGAISDTGACERNPELSHKVNVEGTAYLADACSCYGARLIFCSSDQVYFGNGVDVPHREDESLRPPNLYGRQKKAAEQEVMDRCDNAVCLRLSWMYASDYREGKEHASLLRNISEAVKAHSPMRFPIYDYRSITDVWDAVKNMEKVFTLPSGIYNFGSPNDLCTYELIACAARDIPAVSSLILENAEAFAGKPRNLRMNQEKVNGYGIYFPDALEGLRGMLLGL